MFPHLLWSSGILNFTNFRLLQCSIQMRLPILLPTEGVSENFCGSPIWEKFSPRHMYCDIVFHIAFSKF